MHGNRDFVNCKPIFCVGQTKIIILKGNSDVEPSWSMAIGYPLKREREGGRCYGVGFIVMGPTHLMIDDCGQVANLKH